MKVSLERCDHCGTPFTAVTRSPYDEDRCVSCTPANLTTESRIALFVRDCFQRTAP